MEHSLHHLILLSPMQRGDVERGVSRSQQRLWWLIAGLALLSVFLIGMAMWWTL